MFTHNFTSQLFMTSLRFCKIAKIWSRFKDSQFPIPHFNDSLIKTTSLSNSYS